MRCASSSRSLRASRPSLSTVISALSLRLDPPEADEPAVLQHHARARHRPEQPLAQLGLGREQRPVGLLQIGVARRDQADALRRRRRVERAASALSAQAGAAVDLGELALDAAQRRSACGSRRPPSRRSPRASAGP